MAVYALGDRSPTSTPSAYLHPDCVVIGDVTHRRRVLDLALRRAAGRRRRHPIGARTSIQDGTVLHTTPILPTIGRATTA